MGFQFSKELSYSEGSFEYPQHMFRLKNKKNNFQPVLNKKYIIHVEMVLRIAYYGGFDFNLGLC